MYKAPTVSISCITYNHEKYISQAIEGFLMQKTSFPFEVLIHDDASTDDTANIIREYEAKFPDIIRPIYQTENRYSKRIEINVTYQFPRAKGKYIALCEGDDFWTDQHKLQKQVDFLETNPEYGMIHTDVNHYYEKGKRLEPDFNKRHGIDFPSGNIFDEYLTCGLFIKTASVVVRKDLILEASNNNLFYERKWMLSDLPIWLGIAALTQIKYLKETTATYRLVEGSASFTVDLEKRHKFHLSVFDIRYYYWEQYSNDAEIKRKIDKAYCSMMMGDALKMNDKILAKKASRSYKDSGISMPLKELIKYCLVLFRNLFI